MTAARAEGMTLNSKSSLTSWGGLVIAGVLTAVLATVPATVSAQSRQPIGPVTVEADPVVVPADYVIGPEDVLTINFRYEPDISGDVTVRPDGKISLAIVKDIVAVGLTIEELRATLNKAAACCLKGDPAITVQAKTIKSRKVSIIGEVNKQGEFPLLGPTKVVQLLALAGGLTLYADQEKILIVRTVDGKQTSRIFNYDQFKKGKNLEQNILLQPGDQVIVPE
jgi:polysaccharide export outer membrane protein